MNGNEDTAVPLVPVTISQSNEESYAILTPTEKNYNGEAFSKWLEEEGQRYLTINPYQTNGLKEILKMNDIGEDKVENWEEPTHAIYWSVLLLVQDKGRLGNWTASAQEGFHRFTGSIIRTLACKLDLTGIITANTITSNDFVQCNIGTSKGSLSDADLRDKIYSTTFKLPQTEGVKEIQARALYFTKGGINGCEASYHLCANSNTTSENKRSSVVRCTWGKIGEFFKDSISNMTIHQATCRVHFDEVNPTHRHTNSTKTKAHLELVHHQLLESSEDLPVGSENEVIVQHAYPLADLLKDTTYKAYIENPFEGENLTRVKDLLKFPIIPHFFHVPAETPAHDEIQKMDHPEQVGFPFLPSYATNSIDVGKEFTELSTFNPDTANAAIIVPVIYTYIFAGCKNISLADACESDVRKKHIEYYLRFHNNHGDSSTLPRIHGAFQEHYKEDMGFSGSNICDYGVYMLGALHFCVQIFNAYLSVEAERNDKDKWESREKHFKNMAVDLGEMFTRIGITKNGRDPNSVARVLGKTIVFLSYGCYF